MQLVTATGRGSHLAPAGEGVSSRSPALGAGRVLYSRSNSQARGCESWARISPVGPSRWADLSEKYNTSRLDLRPMPSKYVNRSLRKSPARRWGLGSCPSGERGPAGAWGRSASRWCAPIRLVALSAAGATLLIAAFRGLAASLGRTSVGSLKSPGAVVRGGGRALEFRHPTGWRALVPFPQQRAGLVEGQSETVDKDAFGGEGSVMSALA